MTPQRTIHATFSALAARLSDQTALVGDDQPVTYAELERRSEHVAHYLRLHGVGRGDRVGLYSQRSGDAVAAMLGILKAGAAYVPFDPSYPQELLQFVYADCAPRLMLAQASLVTPGTPAFWQGVHHDIRGAFAGADAGATGLPLPEVFPDDPAYIMYTSGSTGRPKGVLIPHRGVVRLVIANPFVDAGPGQVHLQLAPLAFDASTFEIWGALLNGGKLAVVSAPYPSLDEISQSIARHGVTTLWLTAGLFHLMVDHRVDGLAPLSQLLAGGDVLSPAHVAKAQQALPHCQLINGYGPTENTTFTCCYRIPRDLAPGPIPIGTPIAQTYVHVLDEALQRVPDEQEGELYAGGAGLALGYWNRPDLTAERFVRDPFDPTGTAILYRTGDRVRRRADGNITFLGRVDRQVKINGKRVELDEIEACLRRSALVEDAAVTCPPGEAGARKVHAYVKFRAGAADSIDALRDFVKQQLPDFMCPASFTVMQALPLAPTGKVDRTRLPVPGAAAPRAAAPAPAATEVEAALLDIWRRVLGTNAVGVEDNFFDLGGTSLQLLAVHASIRAGMHSDVSVVDLFQYPRISALAARLMRDCAQTIQRREPVTNGMLDPSAAHGAAPAPDATLNASERARRQHAALARARANPRRDAR